MLNTQYQVELNDIAIRGRIQDRYGMLLLSLLTTNRVMGDAWSYVMNIVPVP